MRQIDAHSKLAGAAFFMEEVNGASMDGRIAQDC